MISLHPRLIKPTGEYFNYGSESIKELDNGVGENGVQYF